MKYKPEQYSIQDTGFYSDADSEIENYKEKLVKCRKPHKCMGGCDKEILVGEYAIRETVFMDGKPLSAYTCTDCLDWIGELSELSECEVEDE